MTAIRYRDAEACEPQPLLLWDTVWVSSISGAGGYGDWRLADPTETGNAGGLRSQNALHTATLLSLMQDKRLPDGMTPPDNDGDRRGWPGDAIRLDGEPDGIDGSLLWTLKRGVLNAETARLAKVYAEDALRHLVVQGAVSRTDVAVEMRQGQGFLGIHVAHYDASGAEVYAQRFDALWTQAAANAAMTFDEVA